MFFKKQEKLEDHDRQMISHSLILSHVHVMDTSCPCNPLKSVTTKETKGFKLLAINQRKTQCFITIKHS